MGGAPPTRASGFGTEESLMAVLRAESGLRVSSGFQSFPAVETLQEVDAGSSRDEAPKAGLVGEAEAADWSPLLHGP